MRKLLSLITLSFLCLSSLAFGAEYPVRYENISLTGTYNMEYPVRSIESDKKYVSADDTLKGAGYQLGWEPYHSAIIVYNPVINANMYIYLNENKIWDGREFRYYENSIILQDGMAYISEEMLFDVVRDSYKKASNSTSFEDAYRRSGNVWCYNGIYLLNGWYAFEKIDITDEAALDYAAAVNAVAASLPENVNVYSMLIPNSAVFYAPKEYAGSIIPGYEKIYNSLSGRVKPVDIYPALLNHADKFIYFNTDHHWTHRGAYYAFEEFMKQKGINVDYINYYGRNNTKNVVGSFESLMKGTEGADLIRGCGETLERFIPPYTITKNVYNDCALQKYIGTGPLINKNINAYSTFIGGDVPVTQIHNEHLSDGSTLCIIKDSYANAFATWAAVNYEYVYLVDIRCFNGANGHTEEFHINDFYNVTGFDDLIIMSYPNTVADSVLRYYIKSFS